MQWGKEATFKNIGIDYTAALNFPITFPNACLLVNANVEGFVDDTSTSAANITNSGFTISIQEWSSVNQSIKGIYFAIGY
jgi:hypothetical protein